jgi:glutamyl-tRNA reductase
MSLVACGINHHTAPVEIRERVAFLPEYTADPLRALVEQGLAKEAAILSTCNRTELYCTAAQPADLVHWLQHWHQLSSSELTPHLYLHEDQAAVRHMLRVASGLDSQVLGEPQILGQMKQAFSIAHEAGTVGSQLQRLFQHVFSVTKNVRTDTRIGANPVSIAFAAVNLAKRIFTDFSATNVLLIGAGSTIDLVAQHLHAQGVRNICIANRTLVRAERLARKYTGQAITLSNISSYLPKADIVITATASVLPVLGKGTVETAIKDRKHRPVLMVDLAVPRNIEAEVEQLSDVYLYTVDDLDGLIQENLQNRREAAEQAEQMIDFQSAHFMRSLRALDAVPTIRAYRDKVESIRNEELSKALQALNNGTVPEKVLAEFAQSITNKVMHDPTSKMRQAAYEGELDTLLVAQRLFDLS